MSIIRQLFVKRLPMKKKILFFTVSILLFSCAEEVKEPVNLGDIKKEVKTEPVKNEPNIETITDLTKIAELREELFKKRQLIERERLDSLSMLDRFLENDSLISDSVVQFLTKAPKKEIATFLNEVLQNKPQKFTINSPAVSAALLNLLKVESMEALAIKTAGILQINYNSTFEQYFLDGKSKFTSKYFFWLGKKGQSLSSIEHASNLIKKGKLPAEQISDVIFGLEHFAHNRKSDIRTAAVQTLMMMYKKKLISAKEISTLKDKENRSEEAKAFLLTMLKYGDASAKSIVSICLKNDLYIKECFQNLIHNKDPKVVAMLSKQFASKGGLQLSLAAVPVVYKSTKDSSVIINLLKTVEKQKDYSPEKLRETFTTINKAGGLDWYYKCESFIKNKDLVTALLKIKKPAIPEVDYEELVLEIFKKGLCDSISPEKIEEITSVGFYVDQNGLLKNLLKYDGRYVSVEKEAAMVPIDYFQLFKAFKKAFPGALDDIEFVSEFKDSKYTLLLIGEKIALFAYPKTNGTFYDLELFISALNELRASVKRFHVFEDQEDQIEVFFGNNADLNNAKSLLIKGN